jgi:oligoendopeptidase F
MFSRFEMRAHERISAQFTSTDELCGMYTEELKRMFGDSVTVLPEYKWEWSAIPHLYEAPFYVYAYNFGNLLVIALYQLYLEEGPSFVPRLKRFLAGGSSASPQDLTRALGVDISRGDFWRKSMAYISGLVDRLETLV